VELIETALEAGTGHVLGEIEHRKATGGERPSLRPHGRRASASSSLCTRSAQPGRDGRHRIGV